MNDLVICPKPADIDAEIETLNSLQKKLFSEKNRIELQMLDAQARLFMLHEKKAQIEASRKAREPKKHMRIGKYACYPRLRRLYTTEELGRVINKGQAGVDNRMHGKIPFSEKEKELILKDLGVEVNAANKRKYFDIGRKEKIS